MLILIGTDSTPHLLESGVSINNGLLYSVDGQRINVKSKRMPSLYIGYTPLARDFNLWYWLELKKGKLCVLGPFIGHSTKRQTLDYGGRRYVQGVIYPFWTGVNTVWCVAVICHTDCGYEIGPVLIDNLSPLPEGTT